MNFKDTEKNEVINQLKAKIQEKIRVAEEMRAQYEYHGYSEKWEIHGHGEWSGKIEALKELLEEL